MLALEYFESAPEFVFQVNLLPLLDFNMQINSVPNVDIVNE